MLGQLDRRLGRYGLREGHVVHAVILKPLTTGAGGGIRYRQSILAYTHAVPLIWRRGGFVNGGLGGSGLPCGRG